jgi:methionine salvage enolase-phosphatase E1
MAAPVFIAIDWNGTVVPFFGAPMYRGAADAVAQWRAAGCLVFIVSHASQKQIADDVARSGLLVDGVFGVDDKGPTFSNLRAQHGSGLVLGDHPSDLRAAQEAGIPLLQACLEGQAPFPGSEARYTDWSEAALLVGALSV